MPELRITARVDWNRAQEAMTRRLLARAVGRVALAVETDAKLNIVSNGQVDTGAMLNSVAVVDGSSEYEKYVNVGVHYGIYQEMGTRYMAGRPFLRPAVEANAAKLEEEVRGVLG